MGDALMQVQVSKKAVWKLPNPTNWTEISKTLSWIKRELTEEALKWDDSVIVEADEEEIRFVTDASNVDVGTIKDFEGREVTK